MRFIATLRRADWVVYAKPPFAGPEQVIALSRPLHPPGRDRQRSAGGARGRSRLVPLAGLPRRRALQDHAARGVEFIRRFLLHVLPQGFMRIRHYGLNANRAKHHKLTLARAALNVPRFTPLPTPPETIEAFWLRVAQLDIHRCPH